MILNDQPIQQNAISGLGSGWLGLPLALYLQAQGYPVRASRTSAAGVTELESQGLPAFSVNFATETALPDSAFWHSPTLIMTVPPQRGGSEAEQLAQFDWLIARLRDSAVRQVLYVSSTSVYAEDGRVVTEADAPAPQKPGGVIVHQLERRLRQETGFRTTVLRFGGLIGYDRLPDSGAAILRRDRAPDSPMNVIHRDDCIRIIHEIIRQEAWGEVFNACADEHPLRRDFYAAAARAQGFELPEMPAGPALRYKIVSSEKLKARLNYKFLYSDPLTVFQPLARDAN